MAKTTKAAPKAKASDAKLAKVNAKSVTIQKADKKAKEKPVKNLKAKIPKNDPASPNQQTKKVKPGKVKIEKKTTPTGGAPIVPKKAAKKLQKAAAKKTEVELISKEEIAKSLAAFKTAVTEGLTQRKALLDPDFRYLLQLCSFKIPQCPERTARTQLTHSLYNETDDICLFVKDIEAGHKRDYQPTIDFFREKLDAAGIKNIKTIMPMSQVVKDYKQHEMARKLSNTYDCFLADARIAPHLGKILGKAFTVQKKNPIPVRMNHAQLKEHLKNAVAKVQYQQTNSGDSIAICVGKHCMADSKVVENIHRVLQNMATEFQGGWTNLKRAYLRPAINLAKSSVLVYNNPKTGEDVEVPVNEGPRAKALAEKQKKLNQLLPEGMVVTSKGELAIVEGRKRPAEKKTEELQGGEKKKAKKEKKPKEEEKKSEPEAVKEQPKKQKEKEKKQKKVPEEKKKAEEEIPVPVEAPAPKKGKKNKAEAVPEPVVDAPAAPVKEKGNKKAKKTATEEVSAAPVKAKKGKKEKVVDTTEDVEDATLSKEVSDLWEQIKSESGGKKTSKKDVDNLWEQLQNESAADLEEEPEPAPKKAKNKKNVAVEKKEPVTAPVKDTKAKTKKGKK